MLRVKIHEYLIYTYTTQIKIGLLIMMFQCYCIIMKNLRLFFQKLSICENHYHYAFFLAVSNSRKHWHFIFMYGK